MKKLLFLSFSCLLSLFSFAQNTINSNKKGLVSADKLNIVYRGFSNPLTIIVPDCKSFTATAPGLTKISENKYTLSPGSGLEVTITLDIILENGTTVKEEHIFKILNMKMLSTINGQNCEKCIVQLTKKEIENATISIYSEPNFNFEVGKFSVLFSETEYVEVKGNTINSDAFQKIKKLDVGTTFKISRIGYKTFFYGCVANPKPITVMIVGE